MADEIVMVKIESENLSPEKYLQLDERERANITSAKVVPARLGKSDFGKIHVTYRTPTYKTASK